MLFGCFNRPGSQLPLTQRSFQLLPRRFQLLPQHPCLCCPLLGGVEAWVLQARLNSRHPTLPLGDCRFRVSELPLGGATSRVLALATIV